MIKTPSHPRRHPSVVVALASTLAIVAGGCGVFGGDETLSEMSLQREQGRVQVFRDDEVIDVEEGSVSLELGDVVKTSKNGLAKLRLEGERVAWVADWQSDSGQVEIVNTKTIEAQAGSLLTDANDSTKVVFGDVEATSTESLFRVDQGPGSARAGSYAGHLRLKAPGQPTAEFSSYFQTVASAGDLRPAAPYQLNEEDPWDRLHLSDVVELETELDGLAGGLANQLGKERPTLAYFRALAGGRDVSFLRPYLDRPVVDLLIGFTLANNTPSIGLKRAFVRSFDLLEDGASWGIVAAIMKASHRPLLAQLEDIIVTTGAVAAGGDETTFSVAAAEAVAGGGAPGDVGPGDGGQRPPPGGGGGDDPGGGEDPDPPEPSPSPECDVQCEIEKALNPTPSPPAQPKGSLSSIDIDLSGLFGTLASLARLFP